VRTVWGEVLPFYPAPTSNKYGILHELFKTTV